MTMEIWKGEEAIECECPMMADLVNKIMEFFGLPAFHFRLDFLIP